MVCCVAPWRRQVTNLDLPEPTLRFNIEHQASHYTVGNLGWQQARPSSLSLNLGSHRPSHGADVASGVGPVPGADVASGASSAPRVTRLAGMQPLHDYWLDLVVEDKHHFVKHYM